MKFVPYNKDSYYFLSDAQFHAAMESWNKGQSIHIESVGALLPKPPGPSGVPPEHLGLDIYYSFTPIAGAVGWVAFAPAGMRGDTEITRAALLRRSRVLSSEDLRYRWAEINVKNPHVVSGFDIADHGTTTQDVLDFMKTLDLRNIDEVLLDPLLKRSVTFDPLLPDYYLS